MTRGVRCRTSSGHLNARAAATFEVDLVKPIYPGETLPPVRRLAAILAADVVGYSRLMGADEEGTLAALKALRRELADPKIKEHRGRVVKTTGDGLLIEFGSVVDAVRCAVEVQREMAERNVEVPPDRRIEFRMGSISATSSKTGVISTAMGLMSRHGLKPWRIPVASASAVWCATKSATSSTLRSRIWASSRSKTSPARYGSTVSCLGKGPAA
jgi:hypothetical protein